MTWEEEKKKDAVMQVSLFEELLHTPINITLDQLLNLVAIFKHKVIISRSNPKALKVDSGSLLPEDVDGQVPTINLKYHGREFVKVLVDGGSRVNILPEGQFMKLNNLKLEPALFKYAWWITEGFSQSAC